MPLFRPRLALLRLGALLLISPLLPAAQAADGKQLYTQQCVACHGATGTGNAALQAPPLAGADADYIARQLRQFRSRMRGGEAAQGPAATMQAIAQALPDEAALQAVAQYIGRFKPLAAKPEAGLTPALLNNGKALFAVCVACHGAHGEGTPALSAPRLTHLPAWYLRSQLQAYREGTRGQHPEDRQGQQMRQVAAELLTDDESLRAVAAFVSSLATQR